MGVIKGDTRRLDYSSYGDVPTKALIVFMDQYLGCLLKSVAFVWIGVHFRKPWMTKAVSFYNIT